MKSKILIIIFLFFSFLFGGNINSFIKNNSYVVDPYNNNRVTSESQGSGLLYAYLINNQKLFNSIWIWTKTHMQRKDKLFAWDYNGKVVDYNNALDGDLLISYALLKAANKWNNINYLKDSADITRAIKKYILNINGNYILMPGEYGFVKYNGIQILPSYYIPFIFKYFYYQLKDGIWKNLYCYTDYLYNRELSDRMLFSFFQKKFITGNTVSLDVYRVILYKYLDGESLDVFKKSFGEINRFFLKNGYIPLKYDLKKQKQTKEQSPYCVYAWFYLVFKNQNYLNKYEQLKKIDKKNYFCSFLDFFLEKGIK